MPGSRPASSPQTSYPVSAPQGVTSPGATSAAKTGPAVAVSEDRPRAPVGAQAGTAGAPDPLAEAGNVVWYVRPPTGGQFGPATADIMRNWIAEGRVSADTLVWREGWRDWQEASEVFPQFGAGRAAISTGPMIGTNPGAAAKPARRPARRQSSKGTQIALLTGLILVVVVLLVVFVWVLFMGPADSNTATATAGAVWFSGFLWGKSRGGRASPAVRRGAGR